MLIKLSHSILAAWAQGRYDQALAYYLGREIPKTPQMELGQVKDQLWSAHAIKTKSRHPELGGGKLSNPIVQQKYEREIKLSDNYTILFRGVIDEEDGDTLTDYKLGWAEPSYYLSGYQLDCYHLLRPATKLGQYLCSNPYTQELKVGVKYFTESTKDRALEFILTNATEFISYGESQKILRDYAHPV